MLYFATASTERVRNVMRSGLLGQIVTPVTNNRLEPGVEWVADNAVFGGRYPGDLGFLNWLLRYRDHADTCRFVVAPDVVADASATLERSRPFLPIIRAFGFPVAYAAQDGATVATLPWGEFDVLFIGGSTDWKLGPEVPPLCAEAKGRGLLIHMGRVNSKTRLDYARSIGCDSADGTFLAFGPDKNLPRLLNWFNLTPSQIPGEIMPPKKKTTDDPTAPATPVESVETAASPLVETALGGAARSTLRATSPIVAEIARVIEFHSSTGGEASRIAQALRDVFGEISRAADAATHKRPANRAAPELFHLNPPALRWLAALARVWAPAEPERVWTDVTEHVADPQGMTVEIALGQGTEPEPAEPLTVPVSPAPPVPGQSAAIAEFERQLIIERAAPEPDPFTEPAPLDTFASPTVREAIGLDPWMLPAVTSPDVEYEAAEPAPAASVAADDIPF